jgi:cytochrome c-type biogenesis protein CcmH/NrfG
MQQTGRLSEACTVYDETLRINPGHVSAAVNLATALHALGRLTEALPAYDLAVQQAPSNVVLLQNYAALLSEG